MHAPPETGAVLFQGRALQPAASVTRRSSHVFEGAYMSICLRVKTSIVALNVPARDALAHAVRDLGGTAARGRGARPPEGEGPAVALGAAEASGAAVPAASAGRLGASSPGQRCPSIESVLAAPPGPWPRGRPHHREPLNARHTAGARTPQPGLAPRPADDAAVGCLAPGGKRKRTFVLLQNNLSWVHPATMSTRFLTPAIARRSERSPTFSLSVKQPQIETSEGGD
ncbi:hypothetical protein HPB47_027408 [Ixodes persulcatus]|uniref:Uncharacterized protein n=1 Tax=Ixodes persulcatus TaxID=34615 RepID=A0AC60PXQ3_IXOPE|nr:hypothetical protein HPB47_027408 [Ixodes persulcatus]